MCGPRLVAELQEPAKRLVVGQRPNWVSFGGGVDALMKHLRASLGGPQVSEATDYGLCDSEVRDLPEGETSSPAHEALPGQPADRGGGAYSNSRSSWTSEATAATEERTSGEAAEEASDDTPPPLEETSSTG